MATKEKDEHVIYLSVFRISLALISMGFFIYFFVYESQQLQASEVEVDKYMRFEEGYKVFVDTLADEQAWLVHYLVGELGVYRIPEALNMSDEQVGEVRGFVDELDLVGRRESLLERLDYIPAFRSKVYAFEVSLVEVFSFYEDLILDLCYAWIHQTSGNVVTINNVVIQDVYHDLIIQSMSMQRDLVVALILGNNTPEDFGLLKKLAYQYTNLQNPIIACAFLASSKELVDYYNNLFNSTALLGALATMNSMTSVVQLSYTEFQQYLQDNYTFPGYPPFNLNLFEESFQMILEAMDKSDTLKSDPNTMDLITRFVLAALGLLFEIVVVISLLWVAIPAIVSLSQTMKSSASKSKPIT